MRLVLSVTSFQKALMGNENRHVFDETGGVIGRARRSDWVLPDPERFVSGTHAEISFDGERFYITDVSTNGLFLNDYSVPLGKGGRWPISNGDRIALGDFELLAQIEDGAHMPLTAARLPAARAFQPTPRLSASGTSTPRPPAVGLPEFDIDSLIGPAAEEDAESDAWEDVAATQAAAPTPTPTAAPARAPRASDIPEGPDPFQMATAQPPIPSPQLDVARDPSPPPGFEAAPRPPHIDPTSPPTETERTEPVPEPNRDDVLPNDDDDDSISAIAELDLDDLIGTDGSTLTSAAPDRSTVSDKVDRPEAAPPLTSTTTPAPTPEPTPVPAMTGDIPPKLPDDIDALLDEPFDVPTWPAEQPSAPAQTPRIPENVAAARLIEPQSPGAIEALSPEAIEAGLALPDDMPELERKAKLWDRFIVVYNDLRSER
jgi:type VI secretion system FHA domain protein